jgi:hypothetical protein
MDKTGTTLAVLTALCGIYIAVALLLARIRDSGWGARMRRRRKRARLAAQIGLAANHAADGDAVRAAHCERGRRA